MSETSIQRTTETDRDPVETNTPQVVYATEDGHHHASEPVSHDRGGEHWDEAPTKRTMTTEIFKSLLSLVILGVGVGIMYGLSSLKEAPKEQVSQELMPMVGTVKAMSYSGQLDKLISGTVVPFREIRVAAEVNGNVVKKHEECEAGNFVKKGTKLIEIDPTDYQLLLETGLAEVEQAQKMLEETEEEIEGAKRNIKLSENEYQLAIVEHNRNARISSALSSSELDVSKRNLLSAESGLTTRKNSLDMLNAKVRRMAASLSLSESQLNRTKLNLSKTTIVAPDDGVIVREMIQEGDYVRAGDQLVTFEDTSRSEVICNLTPSDLDWVRRNSPASSEFQDAHSSKESFSVYYIPKTKVSVYEISDPDNVWDGMLERFDGIGRDESTRTIPCRITIKEPIINSESGPRALVRGMFVKCKIQVQTSADESKRKFLSFPSVALRPGNSVWIVRDHKLQRLDVEVVDHGEQLVGEELQKIVVVAAKAGSLQPGDDVVTTPLAQPSDGADVILEGELVSLTTPKDDAEATD